MIYTLSPGYTKPGAILYNQYMNESVTGFFNELKKRDIICWGSGKHFKGSTYPFLKKSGLIDNLIGFAGPSQAKEAELGGR